MAKKKIEKGTIYQQLNRFFNIGAGLETREKTELDQTKTIIRGTTPQEIEKKAVELQQKKQLQDKFFRTTDRGFQKALQYEAARLPAYIDYEGFEYYPLIASALDLFMEETTTIGENGKMLNIYSSKDRIKHLLEEFMYDIVNVNVNLPFWTRNMPVKHDSMIPLLDGTEITIKKLSERLKNNPNEDIWTYSIQEKTNSVLPGKIVWCDLTRPNTQMVKVSFEDGTFVETTPDHEFILRNGKEIMASNLKEGDSLMPFYTIESKERKFINGYEKVYNPSSNHYKFTHRLVSIELLRDKLKEFKIKDKIVTHHKDFNKKNNHPSNLIRMSDEEHGILHGKISNDILKRPDVIEKRMIGIDKYLRSEKRKRYLSNLMKGVYPNSFRKYNNSNQHNEHNKIRSESMLNHWSDKRYKEKVSNLMRIKFNDKCLQVIKKYVLKENKYLSANKLSEKLKKDLTFISEFKKINTIKRDLKKSINGKTINTLIRRLTTMDYIEYYKYIKPEIINDSTFTRMVKYKETKKQNNTLLNHKVVSVEFLDETHDAYCMEVLGPNGEHDRHNFPICSKNENGDYTRNGVFVSNCKYGDNFVLNYGEKGKGITHIKQMVNYEVERYERVQNGKPTVKFKDRMTGDEFNVFEVAHFRLLGDDKFLPYGSSVLNKVRRVTRQLIMGEDAMLTYRIIRAGEKKVFRIDVGNIDDDDIEDYVYKIATKFKRMPQINPNDGQIDYRFNILGNDEDYFLPVRNANTQTGIDTLPGACLSLDTKIDLLDGRSLPLKEIIKEYDENKELWSYSINPKSGEIVPGKITWAGITRKNTDVLKLTLDNGKTITCTPDHKFPLKYGYEEEAQNLKEGDSLWSFNKKTKKLKSGNGDYEMIYNHNKNEWVYTHQMVDDYLRGDLLKEHVRHHIDFNRFNNNPNNLLRMKAWDHFKLHSKYSIVGGNVYKEKYETDAEFKKSVDERLLRGRNIYHNKLKNDEGYSLIIKEKQTIKYSKKLLDLLIEYLDEFDLLDDVLKYRINKENNEWLIEFNKLNKNSKQLKKSTKITRNNIDKLLKHFGYKNFRDFKSKILQYNHKIVKIEWLTEKQDTGTLTIDGNEEYHNFHNFALSCGVFTKNSNLDAIQDIEYLRDNLFTGLGIPKPFLSFQDASGGGKNMAQFDVRFTKKINRIQQAMIQELNKMAMIHLYLLGYRDEDLGNFTLTLTNPSTQHELMKAELFREKAQTYRDLTSTDTGIAAMSHTKAKRLLFNMTDKEIVKDLKEQKLEMTIKQELQDSPIIIKQTGLFKDIDDRFADEDIEDVAKKRPEGEEAGEEGGGPPELGGGEEGPPPPPGMDENIRKENKMNFKEYSRYLEKFMEKTDSESSKLMLEPKLIISEYNKKKDDFNYNTNTMINEIDNLLKNDSFQNKNYDDEAFFDEIEDIEDIELNE